MYNELENIKGMKFESEEELVNYFEHEIGYGVLYSSNTFDFGFCSLNIVDESSSDCVEICLYLEHENGIVKSVNIQAAVS